MFPSLEEKLNAPVATSKVTTTAAVEILTSFRPIADLKVISPTRLRYDRDFGVGISDVGLATMCMTRSPQTSIRIAPAAVRMVMPPVSLRDSLTANRGSSIAHAAELATTKSKKIPYLNNDLIGVFILNARPSFPVNCHRLDFRRLCKSSLSLFLDARILNLSLLTTARNR